MTHLRRNLIANVISKGWSALAAIAFIPWQIHYLGMESFGLVGFFATLQAACTILDLGLSSAINRQMARLSADREAVQAMADLLRTMEWISWSTALFLALAIAALAPLIAHHWIHADHLPAETVVATLRMMALTIALRWPFNIYSGSMMGLQRQVPLNALVAAGTTLSSVGVIAILAWVSPSIEAFFYWQLAVAGLQTIAAARMAWRLLPAPARAPAFRRLVLLENWRFAAGMGAIGVVSVLLMQVDKIVLSTFLDLERFGYYALASLVANGLYNLITPFYSTVFPAFSKLVAEGDEETLRRLYHRSTRTMMLFLLPAALVLGAYSRDILILWTGRQATAENSATILSLLVAGTALNGMMNMPYALMLAHGWTRLTLVVNLIALAILTPLTIVGAVVWGPSGAAAGWLALNVGYLAIVAPLAHRRLMAGQGLRWIRDDIAVPLTVIGGVLVLVMAAVRLSGIVPPPLAMVSAALLSCYAAAYLCLQTRRT